jgi:hypothetical protein
MKTMGWVMAAFSMMCAAGGCGGSPPTAPRNVSLGEEFELAPAQMASVGETGLTVAFERVSSDSRCPVDVVCVWEGDAAVALKASLPGQELGRLELHTSGQMGPREVRHGDFLITMVALAPQPHSREPIKPTAYRLRLRVSPLRV